VAGEGFVDIAMGATGRLSVAAGLVPVIVAVRS
jgi:hypothetical protein